MPWSGLSRRRDELGLGQRGQRRVDQERVAVLGEDGVGRRTRLPAVGVNRVRRQRVLGREAERLILERELHRLIVCVHRHDGNRPVWVVEADGVEVRQLWDLRREAELRIGRPNREGTLQQRLALPVAAEKEGLVASAVTEARRQLRGDHLEAGVEVDRPPLRFDGGEAPLHLSPAPSGDPRTSSLYPPFTCGSVHTTFRGRVSDARTTRLGRPTGHAATHRLHVPLLVPAPAVVRLAAVAARPQLHLREPASRHDAELDALAAALVPVRAGRIVGPIRNQRGRDLVRNQRGRGEAELLHRAGRVAWLEEQRRSVFYVGGGHLRDLDLDCV
mmetsp:Transcript_35576/g.118930  ORF Transcript_35576/g.118930 Transcript_35576/m.118930 type:complete len:331 (+) Transcript_35576:567-1559(+)